MTGSDRRRTAPKASAWRDDRVWQAGFLVGSALGAAATVLGRRAERAARQGLVDWSAAERVAVDRLRHAPGNLTTGELRATEPLYAAAMARIVPRLSQALGDGAARRRRPLGRRRSGRLGPRERRDVRPADRPARGGAARPGDAAGRRPRQGDDGPRQPLGHDAPARLPARVHGLEGPGPVRPRPADGRVDARQAAVRRGEHPRRRRGSSTCRSTRSAPGSPSTRRPTPSSSRRIRGSGRTSPSGWSAS